MVMNGTGTLYYTVTDHLGSIVQLIDANGTVIEEINYVSTYPIHLLNFYYFGILAGTVLFRCPAILPL